MVISCLFFAFHHISELVMIHLSLWCDVFQTAAAPERRMKEGEGGGVYVSSLSHCLWSSAPVKEGTLMTEGPFVCDG